MLHSLAHRVLAVLGRGPAILRAGRGRPDRVVRGLPKGRHLGAIGEAVSASDWRYRERVLAPTTQTTLGYSLAALHSAFWHHRWAHLVSHGFGGPGK